VKRDSLDLGDFLCLGFYIFEDILVGQMEGGGGEGDLGSLFFDDVNDF
jgi:hypothetical protein